MNLGILILVAIPLGLYLLVLVFSSSDLGPDRETEAHKEVTLQGESDAVAADSTIDTAKVAPSAEPDSSVIASDTSPVVVPALVAEQTHAPEPVAAKESDTPEHAGTAADAVVELTPELAPDQAGDPTLTAPVEQVILAESETAEAPATASAPTPAEESAGSPAAVVEPPKAEDKDDSQPILSGQPLILPGDAPKYAFDYRGRLWVEKKRRGFFRQLRRPQLPPEDPPTNSGR